MLQNVVRRWMCLGRTRCVAAPEFLESLEEAVVLGCHPDELGRCLPEFHLEAVCPRLESPLICLHGLFPRGCRLCGTPEFGVVHLEGLKCTLFFRIGPALLSVFGP